MKYCESIHRMKRRKTREVLIGDVGVGGDNPIRIQSMTTSDTRDIQATVDQVMRLADEGCEIVRLTVQGMKEADACEVIKNTLIQKGYTTPLVADIHFYPPAALKVVDSVEKVRINPGNFADRRASFKVLEYDDATYALELEKIEEKFTPLVLKCKALNRAMRIGTNHGSLSDRIMNRYGDTPMGMVESALEFARICRKNDFHNFVFSMKASNPQVMIQAYRLLAAEMYPLDWDYPLHLGVTEAGEGEDGRIKSAMGIGSLLLDGLGDTIRVSLTEDPWFEIDPCRRLISFANQCENQSFKAFEEKHRQIENIERRTVTLPNNISLHRDGSVALKVDANESLYESIGCEVKNGIPTLTNLSADVLIGRKHPPLNEIGISSLEPVSIQEAKKRSQTTKFANALNEAKTPLVISIDNDKDWESLLTLKPDLLILHPSSDRIPFCRKFFDWIQENQLATPVLLHFDYDCSKEDLVIRSAAEFGSLLSDGLGEGILIEAEQDLSFLRHLSFNILQAARMRMIKTDFISCPSCGRTLFNLQDVTKRIQSRTAHLPGVKIAIMGCIVNGPGEMADADFGYVGSRPGKIDLYVGKECVEKNIDFLEADDRLVELIKTHDRWVDP